MSTTHCRYHPERNAVVTCEKHKHGYCADCLEDCSACTDPELYCQYRTQCIIWENCRREVKKRRTAMREEQQAAAGGNGHAAP